jgi:AraC family transcriptional regulator of adaptative response / DNA-3-methyladenine glycosylase II
MEVDVKLPYNPPFHWNHLIDFLRNRAIENVEWVSDHYQRTIDVDGSAGILKVQHLPEQHSLMLTVPDSLSQSIWQISESVQRIFDLNADPLAIQDAFKKDRKMAAIVNRLPGLRIPGAWDWFEIVIRAILGQQVTIKAARTIAGRIVQKLGTPLNGGSARLFPTPEQFLEIPMDGLGVPARRIEAMRSIAQAAIEKKIGPNSGTSLEEMIQRFCLIPGIGPWTAHYIALRAFSEPDVFLPGDLVLRRSASKLVGKDFTDVELLKYSERWRPWRSYAVLYLWSAA